MISYSKFAQQTKAKDERKESDHEKTMRALGSVNKRVGKDVALSKELLIRAGIFKENKNNELVPSEHYKNLFAKV